ncbi:hypothetical protein [uncultured Parasphingorhabdus sp.]|uniref:hypothetical protein n=1 Tax=uncultured Parasphingorhabdus sp. TaxID=2709694 RepID=UPI0030DC2FAB|tara:strand:- start:19601 stop:19768 length:168 start_codon:yes stop_codon:yes gene_type:complete
MIDNFSIALTHGLLLIAAWRLIHRDDLDVEDPPERDKEPAGFLKRPTSNGSRPDA